MFWWITIGTIWVVSAILVWRFTYQASKINERYDRDAAAYFERLFNHAESRGLENIFRDTKPDWLERELLTSRTKAAGAFRREDSGTQEGRHPSRRADDRG